MTKLYLAGSISGLSGEEVIRKIEEKKAALTMYEILSPMTGKEELRTEIKFKADFNYSPVSCNHAVFERDKWMVSQCDIVFADLVGAQHVSIGTTMELAWAALLGKHTIVAMDKDNIHRHAFILEAADIVLEDLQSAIDYLRRIA